MEIPIPGSDIESGDVVARDSTTEYVPMNGQEAPVGRWTSGFCDYFETCGSSLFCIACCCTPYLYAQLLTRENMTFCGFHGSPEQVLITFPAILTFLVISLLVSFGAIIVPHAFIAAVAFLVYMSMVSSRLRYAMRKRYQIPGTFCDASCDDCICTCPCCSCCSAIQMARHSNQRYECCSTNGLPIVMSIV